MPDQKLDNQLNLAVDTPMEEREKSLDLNVGFDAEENVWDIIVKYSGDVQSLTEEDVKVVPLLGNYAIVTIAQDKLQEFSRKPQVEFIEKPKRLFFAVNQGKTASCIREVQRGNRLNGNRMLPENTNLNLTGKGILLGIVDSGVDVSHPDFRNGDGSTRILRYWDQSGEGIPPQGYVSGVEYTNVEINDWLRRNVATSGEKVEISSNDMKENENNIQIYVNKVMKSGGKVVTSGNNVAANEDDTINRFGIQQQNIPGQDTSGHGTAVLGIAAGNGRASNGRYRGIAYESEIIAVKLGIPRDNSFPRTTELIQGIDYLVRQAMELERPMVINLSFGNNYGSHEPYN